MPERDNPILQFGTSRFLLTHADLFICEAHTAERYADDIRNWFLSPFLAHRLSDIAGNHQEKKTRKMQPIFDRAATLGLSGKQPLLAAAMRG